MMVEYFSKLEGYILEAATSTCDHFGIDDFQVM